MTDAEIKKALECCSSEDMITPCPKDCPMHKYNGDCFDLMQRDILDLINRLEAEKEALIAGQETLQKALAEKQAEIETLKNVKKENDVLQNNISAMAVTMKNSARETRHEAYKEFAEKVDEILKRYAHLHKYAEKARHSTEEYADGTPMKMVSVWEVLSLKKWEMCDYETMSTLQDNIETIEKARLLSELEKDFMLLKKEMVGDAE